MASAYYEQSVVKSDLGLTGTGLDTQLDDWSDKVEARIDNLIFEVWSKRRNQSTLPHLPLTGSDITEDIKDAANAGVKSKYYEEEMDDEDKRRRYDDQLKEYVGFFVNRYKVTKKVYIRGLN